MNIFVKMWRHLLCACGHHSFQYDEQVKSDHLGGTPYWLGYCTACRKENRIPFSKAEI